MGTQIDRQSVVVGWLDQHRDQIAAALPKHMTADRMARIALTEFRKTPKLLQCDPKSLFGAVVQTSQLGLEPGGHLGHAYLVPYGRDCTLIIGYRGMIELAMRSGKVHSVQAFAVYESDDFDYELGLTPTLRHKPSGKEPDPAKLTHVYSVCRMKDGGEPIWNVMTRGEVEAIKRRSKAGSKGPWTDDFVAMAKKTAIRALFKYLPVSIEVQQAVSLDEQGDLGTQDLGDFIEGEVESSRIEPREDEEPATGNDKLREKMADKSVEEFFDDTKEEETVDG